MPLQQTSGAASYDAFGGGVPVAPKYIEDYFSTWLTTGTGSGSQTITNGIDLSGKGGMVWWKTRNAAYNHYLFDTNRGATNWLVSNQTSAQETVSNSLTSFNSDGFTIGDQSRFNGNTFTDVAWSFAKAPKFFEQGVDTNNPGMGGRTITHGLGSTPGCIIIKRTNAAEDWYVWHRSLPNSDDALILNSTAAVQTNLGVIYNVNSTTFTLNGASGGNYVWYVFAHNAGGFGLSGTDNVISCGSYTTNGSGFANITLGYEPQWVLIKRTDNTGNWELIDSMRGFTDTGLTRLNANTSGAEEYFGGDYRTPTATGFYDNTNPSATFIYIAIRRGPMRTPTTGTSVFSAKTYTATTTSAQVTHDVTFDMEMSANRDVSQSKFLVVDSLRGINGIALITAATGAEVSYPAYWSRKDQRTMFAPSSFDAWWAASSGTNSHASYGFVRAPGFFDEVCYTGTGSARTIAHNLAAVPELIILKSRSNTLDWAVYSQPTGNTNRLLLNTTNSAAASSVFWNNTSPTSSVFTIGLGSTVNSSGDTYVAYLFASCPGVSKVGSYTGNGSSQTIDCGFAGGARFVMIKRTDSTGNWMVVDTARGLVAAGDPTLYLNSTAAEVTGVDWLDPDSSGFIVNQEGTMNANVSSATYIYLAIS